MFGGTHEQKFASTLANFVHLSLSSYNEKAVSIVCTIETAFLYLNYVVCFRV